MNITGTNVTIMVKDMDASINLYESIGLTLQNRWDNHYAMVVASGITIGIHPANENSNLTSGSLSIGFMAGKIQEAAALIDDDGIAYKKEDGKSGIYLHFKDPDGTALYFVEPKW
ncbi:MAG: VOC family protein [Bacteroidota bacterium]|nr:VOC family protein [Bacteroidota bacterium]